MPMINSSGRMMSLERILVKAHLTDANFLPKKISEFDLEQVDSRMKETVVLIDNKAFNFKSGSNRRDFALLIKENQLATTKVYQDLEKALCELVSIEDIFVRLFGLKDVPREKSSQCLELVNSVAEWMHCLVHKSQGLIQNVAKIQPEVHLDTIEYILQKVKFWILESFDLRAECVCATNFIKTDCLPLLEAFGKDRGYDRNHVFFKQRSSSLYLKNWTDNVESLLSAALEAPARSSLEHALQENFWLNLEMATALKDLKVIPGMKVTCPQTEGSGSMQQSMSGLSGAEGWTLEELRIAVDLCIRSFMRRRFSISAELPAFLKSSITELRISSELHSVILANLDKMGGARLPPRLSCDACRFPVNLYDADLEGFPHRPFKVMTYTAVMGNPSWFSGATSADFCKEERVHHLETAIRGFEVVLLQDMWVSNFPSVAAGNWNKVANHGCMILSKFPVMYEDSIIFGGTMGRFRGWDAAVYTQLAVDTEYTDDGTMVSKHRIHVINVRLKASNNPDKMEDYRSQRISEMQELMEWIARVTHEAESEESGESFDSDYEEEPQVDRSKGFSQPKCFFGNAANRIPDHLKTNFDKRRRGLRWPVLIGGNFNIDALDGPVDIASTEFSQQAPGLPSRPSGSHEYMETSHLIDQVGESWFDVAYSLMGRHPVTYGCTWDMDGHRPTEVDLTPEDHVGTRQSLSRFFYVAPSRSAKDFKSDNDVLVSKGHGGLTGAILGPIGCQIERLLLNPAREKPQLLTQVSPHFGVTTIMAPLMAVQPRKRDEKHVAMAEGSSESFAPNPCFTALSSIPDSVPIHANPQSNDIKGNIVISNTGHVNNGIGRNARINNNLRLPGVEPIASRSRPSDLSGKDSFPSI